MHFFLYTKLQMLDNSEIGVLIINRNYPNWFSITEYYFLLHCNKTAGIPLNSKWGSSISIKTHVNQTRYISVEANDFHYPFPLISIHLKWLHFKWSLMTWWLISILGSRIWQGYNLAALTCSCIFTSWKSLLNFMIDCSWQPTRFDSFPKTALTSAPASTLFVNVTRWQAGFFFLIKKEEKVSTTFFQSWFLVWPFLGVR